MDIHWPVIYIHTATAEPLRLFSRQDWCDSLAARYSLSHITEGRHFFIDASENVYRLVGKGMISPGFQIIDLAPDDRPDILELVRERAAACHTIAPASIADLIAALSRHGAGSTTPFSLAP